MLDFLRMIQIDLATGTERSIAQRRYNNNTASMLLQQHPELQTLVLRQGGVKGKIEHTGRIKLKAGSKAGEAQYRGSKRFAGSSFYYHFNGDVDYQQRQREVQHHGKNYVGQNGRGRDSG